MGGAPSTSIPGAEILDNRPGVGFINRRAHDVDHFLYLSLPLCRTEERGIHLDIVKAVTSCTIGFDFFHTWARHEAHSFLRSRLREGENDHGPNDNRTHCWPSLQAAFKVSDWIKL